MRLVRIPPGSSVCGSDAGYHHERPAHEVIVTHAFWLSEFPITQEAYRRVIGRNPSRFAGALHPVESVSWHDVQEFCYRLTNRERASGFLPRGAAFRLPTELEWEYACRGGNQPVDAPAASAETLAASAWFVDNSNDQTHPVGGRKPNPLGLFDMLGNVGEWCADWFAPYPAIVPPDYWGPPEGKRRVRKGGCWDAIAGRCRPSTRIGVRPDCRSATTGFRVVLAVAG